MWVLAPVLLLYVVVMTPAWMHDHQLAGLVDRALGYPLPKGSDLGDYEPQSEVRPDADLCNYHVRFEIETEASAEEVLTYYRTAKITPVGEGDLAVNVWEPFGPPASPMDDPKENGGRRRIIVELQDNHHDGGFWDLRCL
ncbi:hypothetical protein [Streptosporangium sp. NPDC020145]|uniref:hypothetical protein n=1 Tax=Streptosporangium sp. NPDC020145 TaxID=3154694 RepID=UPI003419D700